MERKLPRGGWPAASSYLPEAFTSDPDRLARFEREAKVLASLNHPNIGSIYGLEEAEGGKFRALVLELVEGPTLADRIKQGPIPIDEALSIAKQIAEALEAAHERGVIHRDLKPANITVKDDGTVKVLDFGLAKALAGDAGSDPSESPTLTAAATQMGVIMGTAAYMSPEQARGKTVDRRSDIWAFGCVLFEMLTSTRAFGGDDVTDTLASALRAEPEWNALPADTPSGMRRLLRRCLRKEPRERLRDVGDARLELADAEEPTVTTVVPRSVTRRVWWSVAAVALLIASYAAGVWRGGEEVPPVEWSGELLGGPSVAMGPRVSPDGQMLAFEAMVDGLTQVGIMQLQSRQWEILTDGRSRGLVRQVAWSPDSSSVYFDRFTDVPRGVFRVPVFGGGEPQLMVPQAMTPEPLQDGSLMFVRLNEQRQQQIFRFWPETGRIDALNGIIATAARRPTLRASPDGRDVLFFGRPLDRLGSPDHLYGIDLESGTLQRLAEDTSFSQYNWTFPLAVTRDGTEMLVDIVSGNLHRIVALPRSGSGQRPLLSLTSQPIRIDVGRDGAIYVDLWERPTELLISDATAPDSVARTAISNVSNPTAPKLLPLPDGRILMTRQIAGRSSVMAFTPGGRFVPLFETQEETSGPMALVGRDMVALLVGSEPDQALALASTSDGRIDRRFDTIATSEILSVAGSPDGRTLYYAASGNVSAIDLETSTSHVLHPGEAVAIDPTGDYAVVALEEQGGVRLVKVFLADGRAEDIPNRSEFALATEPIEPNAIARDGRIVVRIAPNDLWFFPTGILDPGTGRIERAWPEIDADMFGGWAEDGRLIAGAMFVNSSLWRFSPQAP